MEVEKSSSMFGHIRSYFSRPLKRQAENQGKKNGFKRAAIDPVTLPIVDHFTAPNFIYPEDTETLEPIQDDKTPPNIEYDHETFKWLHTNDETILLDRMFSRVSNNKKNLSPDSRYPQTPKQPTYDSAYPTTIYDKNFQSENASISSPENQFSPEFSPLDEEQHSPQEQPPQQMTLPQPCTTLASDEQPFWGKIVYYEKNQRFGDPFLCTTARVTVDGLVKSCSQNGDRFSICAIATHSQDSKILRPFIRSGVRFSHTQSEILLENLSDNPIFVQSRIFNCSHNLHLNTVVKLEKSMKINVFSFETLNVLLKSCLSRGYNTIYELTKACTIRIAFLKGWGEKYRRLDVTGTPCWIELHVYEALQFLDKVLLQLYHPNNTMNSVT